MPAALDLMDHELHVILTVNVALAAVSMLGILFLMLDHRNLGVEVLVAHWIGALDIHDGSEV